MLRITVHERPQNLTLQIEGKLTGPWIGVLQECWKNTRARPARPALHVDLTGVTFIDAAGRDCLMAMHRQGAEFVTGDCLTKAVVAEITQASSADAWLQATTEPQHKRRPC